MIDGQTDPTTPSDPTHPVGPSPAPTFETFLMQHTNDAIQAGKDPEIATDRLGQVARYLQQNPDVANQAEAAIKGGKDPAGIADRLWQHMQQPTPTVPAAPQIPGVASESTSVRPGGGIAPSAGGNPLGSLEHGSILSAIDRGATLGFAPQIEGGLGAVGQLVKNALGIDPKSLGQAYSQTRDEALARQGTYETQHPVGNAVGQLVGGVALGNAVPALNLAKPGAGLLARMGAGAVEGAGWAGASGFGNTQGDITDRLKGAAQQLPAGAIFGGAVPLVASTANGIRGLFGGNADDQATQQVLQALQRDKMTVTDFAQAGQDAASTGKPYLAMDVGGKNLQGTAQYAATTPSGAKEALGGALESREAQAPERIIGALQQASGITPIDPNATAENLIEQAKRTAAPLYEQAKPMPLSPELTDEVTQLRKDFPEIDKAFARGAELQKGDQALEAQAQRASGTAPAPTMNPQWQALQKQFGDDPVMLESVAKHLGIEPPTAVQGLTVGDVHYAKLGMDDLINHYAERGGVAPNRARQLQSAFGTVLDQMEAENPVYKQARLLYKGPFELKDALEAGQSILSDDPRVTKAYVDALSPGEQSMYKAGAFDALQQAKQNTPEGTDLVKKLFGTENKRAAIQSIFPDEKSYTSFLGQMKAEQALRTNSRSILGGSNTYQKMALADNKAGPIGLGDLLGGLISPHYMMRRMASSVGRSIQGGQGNAVADQLGEMLGTPVNDPSFNDLIQRLTGVGQQAATSQARQQMASRITGMLAGSHPAQTGQVPVAQ